MGRLAGAVFPSFFSSENLISSMLESQRRISDFLPYTHFWRQIQIGQDGVPVASNQKKDRFILIDGDLVGKDQLQAILKTDLTDSSSLILQLYEQFGERCFEKLDGDFSLALLDKRENKLILVRDRMGKKPLYWSYERGHFLFASEIKALLATGILAQTPSSEALATYLAFGYFPQDVSPIESINKLLPGHYLVLEDFKRVRICPFWSLSQAFSQQVYLSEQESLKQFEEKLQGAFDRRCSDEPSVCFFREDRGSMATVRILEKRTGRPSIHTLQFQDKEQLVEPDERRNFFSAPFEGYSLTAENFLDSLAEMIWRIEEPIGDLEVLSGLSLFKTVSPSSRVFSALGSEELFTGYGRYSLQEKEWGVISRLFQRGKEEVKKGAVRLLNKLGSSLAYDLLRNMRRIPYFSQYIHQNLLSPKNELLKASPSLAPLFDPIVFLEKFHHLSRISSSVSALIYLDLKTKVTDQWLLPYERLSSYGGISWATPFLDTQFLEFVVSLKDPEISFKNWLKKQGLPGEGEWTRKSKKVPPSSFLKNRIWTTFFQGLSHSSLIDVGFIEKSWLEKVLASPKSITQNFRFLFALLVLEIWMELFITKPLSSASKTPITDSILNRGRGLDGPDDERKSRRWL